MDEYKEPFACEAEDIILDDWSASDPEDIEIYKQFDYENYLEQISKFYEQRDVASLVNVVDTILNLFKKGPIPYTDKFVSEFAIIEILFQILANPPDHQMVLTILRFIVRLTYKSDNYVRDFRKHDPPLHFVLREIFHNPGLSDDHRCLSLQAIANVITSSRKDMYMFWGIWENKQALADASENPVLLPHIVRLLYAITCLEPWNDTRTENPDEMFAQIAYLLKQAAVHVERLYCNDSKEAKHVLRVFLMALIKMTMGKGGFTPLPEPEFYNKRFVAEFNVREINSILVTCFFAHSDHRILTPTIFLLGIIYEYRKVEDERIFIRLVELLDVETQPDQILRLASSCIIPVLLNSPEVVASIPDACKCELGVRLIKISQTGKFKTRNSVLSALYWCCNTYYTYIPFFVAHGLLECLIDMIDMPSPDHVTKALLLLDCCFQNQREIYDRFVEIGGVDAIGVNMDNDDPAICEALRAFAGVWFAEHEEVEDDDSL